MLLVLGGQHALHHVAGAAGVARGPPVDADQRDEGGERQRDAAAVGGEAKVAGGLVTEPLGEAELQLADSAHLAERDHGQRDGAHHGDDELYEIRYHHAPQP